jgi:hypothetical protein
MILVVDRPAMRPPRLNWFSVFFGLFVAFPVVGIEAVLFGWSIVESFVIGVGIALLVACVVEYVSDIPLILAHSKVQEVFTFVPTVMVVIFGMLISIGISPLESSSPLTGIFVLAGFGIAGLGVYITADNRLVSHVRSSESILIEWTATPTDRYIHRLRIVYITVGGILLVGGFGLMVIRDVSGAGSLLATPGVVIMAQSFVLCRSMDFTAFESGLAVHSRGIHTAFIPWNRFTSYERTDEELVLRKRLPITTIHCDLTDIDDSEAIEETLREALN